jgi:hypothetical protein
MKFDRGIFPVERCASLAVFSFSEKKEAAEKVLSRRMR